MAASEKMSSADVILPIHETGDAVLEKNNQQEAQEIFQKNSDGVDFRTVSWPRATVIFLKMQFAMSILAVPGSLAVLGAVGGGLSIVGWMVLNTCKSFPG
jgi:hypothetical protein